MNEESSCEFLHYCGSLSKIDCLQARGSFELPESMHTSWSTNESVLVGV